MSAKVRVFTGIAEHPVTKKMVSKEELVKLTGKFADDESVAEQLKETLEVES